MNICIIILYLVSLLLSLLLSVKETVSMEGIEKEVVEPFLCFFPVVYVESSYQHVRCECDQNIGNFRKFPDELTVFKGLWLSQCLG